MFDLMSLKNSIRDTLQSYMYPQCLEGTIISSMVNTSNTVNIEYAQSFIHTINVTLDKTHMNMNYL